MHIQSKPSYKISSSVLSCLALCLIASACTTMPSQKSQLESLNYRSDRYADMQKLDQYTSCQAQGMALDQRAQSQADISSYLASARKLSECQSFLEGKTHLIDSKTQMHVRAISILNFIKGGDIAQARSEFETFQTEFNGKDLTFRDGTSFSQAVSMLIFRTYSDSAFRLETANIRPQLKKELRRITYWKAF